MWQACKTQEEIAEAVEVDRTTISKWEDEFVKNSDAEDFTNSRDFDPPIYNVWKQQAVAEFVKILQLTENGTSAENGNSSENPGLAFSADDVRGLRGTGLEAASGWADPANRGGWAWLESGISEKLCLTAEDRQRGMVGDWYGFSWFRTRFRRRRRTR
jgi:hypothetical protein